MIDKYAEWNRFVEKRIISFINELMEIFEIAPENVVHLEKAIFDNTTKKYYMEIDFDYKGDDKQLIKHTSLFKGDIN